MNSKKSIIIYSLKNLDLLVSIGCMAVLISITFVNALLRYVLNSPFAWVDEMQMWMIIWSVSYGASAVFRHSKHISIDMIVELLPKNVARIIAIFVFLITSGILAFMTYTSFLHVSQLYKVGRVTSVMSYPQALVYSSVPIGFALMLVSYLNTNIRTLISKKAEDKTT